MLRLINRDFSILITIISWDYLNLSLATSEYQPSLSNITNVAQGRSANQIAENKGNNKITEHRAIFQRERQNS